VLLLLVVVLLLLLLLMMMMMLLMVMMVLLARAVLDSGAIIDEWAWLEPAAGGARLRRVHGGRLRCLRCRDAPHGGRCLAVDGPPNATRSYKPPRDAPTRC
jgi:hypothetical protein